MTLVTCGAGGLQLGQDVTLTTQVAEVTRHAATCSQPGRCLLHVLELENKLPTIDDRRQADSHTCYHPNPRP